MQVLESAYLNFETSPISRICQKTTLGYYLIWAGSKLDIDASAQKLLADFLVIAQPMTDTQIIKWFDGLTEDTEEYRNICFFMSVLAIHRNLVYKIPSKYRTEMLENWLEILNTLETKSHCTIM